MSFNGSFAVSLGATPLSFVLTDNSTGSDTNLTDRRITLYMADGSVLVPVGSTLTYIDWPIGNGPITISLLTQDFSLNISVQWISSSPLAPPSTYALASLNTFTGNSQLADYGLTQQMVANWLLAQDDHFLSNKELLQLYIENAVNATTYNDQFNAQLNLNAAYELTSNLTQNFS